MIKHHFSLISLLQNKFFIVREVTHYFRISSTKMVVGSEQKANPADVVLVVEATANLSAYIDVLKKYYIIPSLE